MRTKLTTALQASMFVIGTLLLLNGLFHCILYLFDDRPLMSGLRYLNWISLVMGMAFVLVGGAGFFNTSSRSQRLSH